MKSFSFSHSSTVFLRDEIRSRFASIASEILSFKVLAELSDKPFIDFILARQCPASIADKASL